MLEQIKCHDWVLKKHPGKAQSFTSEHGMRFTTFVKAWEDFLKPLSVNTVSGIIYVFDSVPVCSPVSSLEWMV